MGWIGGVVARPGWDPGFEVSAKTCVAGKTDVGRVFF